MIYLYIFVALVIAYLCGSIPSAVWIGKRFWGIDVREHGSKNAGSTNVLRVLGPKAALPVFILDILKGFVAVSVMGLLPRFVAVDENVLVSLKIIAVFAAVFGHILPIFAGFKGGKGVATLVGSIAAVNPPLVLLCFVAWFIVLAISHYVSLSSMVAGCLFPIFTLLLPSTRHITPLVIFSCVTAILLIITHRKNIGRLLSGTESKIYLKRPKKSEQEN
ncbi:MAG: glycerol-3-phosphate 1-O-acyltransferase PlsY [Rikenellaceae bacterium]